MKIEVECKTYTVSQAAKIIGVCSKTAYQMVTSGKLPCIRISDRKVVIPKAALEQWLVDAVQWPDKTIKET
ncbi:helix-turn-helix domain-containing protein [Desulfosporosinus nitroreducens]|uniref:Helix-turn-helix domain-containing protein n=1 Tax=Desulfosporosinus nitroreducens TaxID=2018668 RepID=A0ABT8QQT5_9FIRM|nr:helix-turn-helix domain-containing protein [Desulfosporosinus nitroreducens]MDO0823510.1 helix-turn-helix domain-containing protein [Desulfosporosinus nitroreducens]